MFIPKLNSKCVFKYPFDGGKKVSLVECFERNKVAYFLFVYLLQIQFLSVFRQPTARRYSSVHVNDLELKIVKITYKCFAMFSFQIFCAKNFSKLPFHTVELNQTR